MQVETMKARTRVHGYMIYINIYIYILECTKLYKKIFKRTNETKQAYKQSEKKKKQIITMHAAARHTHTVAAADW